MSRASCMVFVALLVVVARFSLGDLDTMPERIAIHFRADGAADRWTTNTGYRFFIMTFVIGLPGAMVVLVAGLPRLTNGVGLIPNSAYWFAPEHRRRTLAFLTRHSCWLGCLTIAATYGMHVTIVRANAVSPPVADVGRLSAMVMVYLLGLVWWIATLIRHFRKSGE